MALKKISIDGSRLRSAIRDQGQTIKGLAERVRIGEKTMHRLLNGEEIRSDKVEKIFTAMNLKVEDFIQGSNFSGRGGDSAQSYTFTGNSEITLSGFEIPDFRLLPLTLTWRLDVPSPNTKQLEALQQFNATLSSYLSTKRDSYVDFDTEFTKLSMGHEISNAVSGMRDLGIYAYFGVYQRWISMDEDYQHFYDGYKMGVQRIYLSQNLMAVLMTSRVKSGTVQALVDKGDPPYDRMFNDSRRFIRTVVDEVELEDLPEHISPESYFDSDNPFNL